MSLTFELKQYYRIATCLSVALGLVMLPAAAAEPRKKTATQTDRWQCGNIALIQKLMTY
jgi:hypothetical protein